MSWLRSHRYLWPEGDTANCADRFSPTQVLVALRRQRGTDVRCSMFDVRPPWKSHVPELPLHSFSLAPVFLALCSPARWCRCLEANGKNAGQAPAP